MSLQPAPGEMRWMQLRVGLVAAAVLVVVAIGILRLDAVGSIFGRPVEFTVRLTDGLGVREGSQVTVAGLPAGIVTRLEIVPVRRDSATAVAARIRMNPEQFALLRSDASSRVRALGLLGDRLLDFAPGTPSRLRCRPPTRWW